MKFQITKEQTHLPHKVKQIVMLSVLAIIGLALIFPPLSIWPLAFVGIAPLLYICRFYKPLVAAGIVYIIGMILENVYFYWIFEVAAYKFHHNLILGLYFGVYWAVWAYISSVALRSRISLIQKMLVVSSAWTIMDYLMAHMGFMSFPWNTLAHSQYQNLWLLQWASVFGEYGIVFFIVAINFIIYSYKDLSSRFIYLNVIVFVVVHLIGGVRYYLPMDQTNVARIAVLQPSFLRAHTKENQDPILRLQRLLSMTKEILQFSPELVVWPEAVIRGQSLEHDQQFVKIQSFVSENLTPIVFGFADRGKFVKEQEKKVKQHNSAVLFSVYNEPVVYNKRLLMPFMERAPLEGIVQWPAWIMNSTLDIEAGSSPVEMNVGQIRSTPIICWENLFADFIRSSIMQETNLIIDIVNDNWFGVTPAPYQHNVISIFRAVENNIPMVISSNTGPSQIIDSKGNILASATNIFEKKTIIADLKLNSTRSAYYHLGDSFVFICFLILLIIFFRIKRSKN